jgi:hypothetical protein
MFLMGMWTDVKKNYHIFFGDLGGWPLAQSVWSVVSIRSVVSSRSVQLVLWFRLAIRRPFQFLFQFVRRFRRPWNTPAVNTAGDLILPPPYTHIGLRSEFVSLCGRSIPYWSRLRQGVPLRRLAFVSELLMQRLHVVGRGVGRGNMFSVAHPLWAEV